MAFVIKFSNSTTPAEAIGAVATPGLVQNPDAQLGDIDAVEILSSPNFYYATNNLQLELIPEVEEDRFYTDSAGVCPVTAKLFWRLTDTGFLKFNSDALGVSSFLKMISINASRKKMSLSFDPQAIDKFKEHCSRLGLAFPPEFGVLGLTIPLYQNERRLNYDFAIKYSHNPVFTFIAPGIPPKEKIVSEFIAKPVTFETLYVPTVSSSFTYNFFDVKEADYERQKLRNYKNKFLYQIPKFVRLSWKPSPAYVDLVSTRAPAPTVGPKPEVKRSSTDSRETGGVTLGGVRFSSATVRASNIASYGNGSLLFTSPSTKTSSDAKIFSSITESLRDDPLLSEDLVDAVQPTNFLEESKSIAPDFYETLTARSEYSGYVILKYRVNEDDGTLEPLNIVVIPGQATTTWIDWQVAYGETYHYEMRSVFKFVNNFGVPVFEDSNALLARSGSAELFDSGLLIAPVHYFDSAASEPTTVQAIDLVRPDPPRQVKIFPNSVKKQIFISWSQTQQNRDVLGFNIYRKLPSKASLLTRLNNEILDIRHNFFIDQSVEYDKDYVYVIEAVDRHGNISKLSVQYIARITKQNPEVSQRVERPIKLWEREGKEPNEEENFDEPEVVKFNKHLEVTINPLFRNLDQATTYLLRITSLDTAQEKEIKLNFKTKIINRRSPVDSTVELTPEMKKALDPKNQKNATFANPPLLGNNISNRLKF